MAQKKQLVENSEDATWSDPYSKETAGDRVQNIQGRTFLTATAALPLIEQLERQLEAVGQKEGYADQVNALKDRNLLSQRLAGFNDVMLMRKPILQLPVTDPLARTEILSDFTNRVRAVVGERNGISPLPANLFLPLREGPFQIRKVRLVDRWGEGRVYEFAKGATSSRVIISQALRTPKEVKGGNSRMAYLPPRLVQPARINFRWLATDHASAEAGTHANNSPICGYVVPNFLDSSIHVFNEAGEGLLVIARSGDTVVERPFPGKQEIIEPKDQLLNKLIHSITGKNRRIKKLNMLKDLLEAARESTGANLPENYAQFDGLALLMGCPLALVRAKLDLELRGEPSINQSWNARETEYFGRERHVHPTLDFEKLRFAVRLGEKHRANDGFFAYFILKGDNLIREVYSPYAKPHTLHASATDLTAEKYWNELSNLKKWLELEEERRNSRKAEEKKLKKRLPAISKRLQELESYHDLTNEDVQEQILLQNAQNELENRAKGLPNEIALIEARITAYNTDIDKLQREHGYKSSGLGLYKPHGDLLTLSAEADELHLGILMDPRSPVHLTTGVLPEKRIDIPPDLFADALNNIQMAFLTTPVISPEPVWQAPESESDELVQQPFLLTAPFQPGYEWSWLQPGATEKENIHFPADQIQEPRTGYFQPAGPQIIFDGWMKLQPTTTKPSSTSDKTDRDE
jgi:phage FluMu protein gp41